jgi:phytoene synthase
MTPQETPLDQDRLLALAYVPAARREALRALWEVDAALGNAIARSMAAGETMLREIRLVWWREALEALDHGPAPAEPVLGAASALLLPAGIKGGELALLEEGWALLLKEGALSARDLDLYAQARGGRLFRLAARLLGEPSLEGVGEAGESWALADLARRASRAEEAEAALAAARMREPRHPPRWTPALRPIGMLAVLARRDAARGLAFEQRGAPPRMLRMVRHRLSGR